MESKLKRILKQSISDTFSESLHEVLLHQPIDNLLGSRRAKQLLFELTENIFTSGFQDARFKDRIRNRMEQNHFDPSVFLNGKSSFVKVVSPKGKTLWICSRCFVSLKDLSKVYQHRHSHCQFSSEKSNSLLSVLTADPIRLVDTPRIHVCGNCQVEFREKQFIAHFQHCNQILEIAHHYRVIRGDFSQHKFDGFPCTAMAAAFIYYSTFRNIHSFTTSDINDILNYGGYYLYPTCRERLPHNNAMLTATELEGFYKQPLGEGSEYYFKVHEQDHWEGLLRGHYHQHSIDSLSTSIYKLLISNYNYAIITTNSLSMGIVNQTSGVYLFDSHSRDEKGHAIFDYGDGEGENGKACVMLFNSFDAANPNESNSVAEEVGKSIADHIIGNVKNYHTLIGADGLENLPSSEIARYYMHTITPVSITFK